MGLRIDICGSPDDSSEFLFSLTILDIMAFINNSYKSTITQKHNNTARKADFPNPGRKL